MSKFFKTEDFAGSTELIDHISWDSAASVANAKLEREAVEISWVDGTRKAVILPMKNCSHPKDKVQHYTNDTYGGLRKRWFQCECGAKVQPKEFEEIK